MPVTVHIPIRVRVDADALTANDSGAIDEIGARAGRRGRPRPGQPRARSSSIRAAAISGCASTSRCSRGPAIASIVCRAHTRRLLEARLRAVVLRRAEETLIGDRRETPVPEAIPANPAEPIDRRRCWAPAGYYALPSYDRQGKTVHRSRPPTTTSRRRIRRRRKCWTGRPSMIWKSSSASSRKSLAERNRQPPQSGLLGFIFLSPDGYLWIHIPSSTAASAEHYWDAPVDLRLPKWDQDKQDVVYVPTPVRPGRHVQADRRAAVREWHSRGQTDPRPVSPREHAAAARQDRAGRPRT